jgi:spore coat polysaccharide biosynthesis predicted glycosyltransferase SpsG
MTSRVLLAAADLPGATRRDLEVRVVVGAANADVDRIIAVADRADMPDSGEQALDDMVAPIAWADLAVTSGGTTVWELARLGCPSVVIETGPSEMLLAGGLERLGLFDRLGPADHVTDEQLRTTIARRLADHRWRTDMARRGVAAVDGQGAGRVVDALTGLDAR